ncbi:glycosyltransferase family 2 protein [Gemella cuniculi]|uniref:glycosyltransferase family 2 protein n=1 Tax=Gemella cuniculi TaxID=150240 RepID=UPI0004037004|nr:glycosyltransferase family 2 protein [Gemella cuniculi]
MEKLLTIVVPTYNIEKYIDRCIESFKNVDETLYKLFEILVINDGSQDNSVKVVENLILDSDLDVIIINKENGGHGSTINRGIKEAKGKYFKVIDGDDWVDTKNFEEFLHRLQEIDVDMVITDYTEQHLYSNKVVHINFLEELSKDKVTNKLPQRRIPMHSLTYKTNVLRNNSIYLSENSFYVDIQYTLFPLEHTGNYVYWNLDIYQYFLGRPDQSMNISVMKKNANHHDKVTKTILDFYHKIYKRDELKIIVSDTLKYLINKQCLLFLMNGCKSKVYELFKYADNKKYKYTYNKAEKTTGLLYFNYKTKGIFSFIITQLVNNKVKKLGEENVN